MIIRIENSRENFIRVYDIFQKLNFRCIKGSLYNMINEMNESSKNIDDMFNVSKKYLGDTNQVRYVRCNFIARTFEVFDELPDEKENMRVDYETFMTVLRVKRCRKEYEGVLLGLLGSVNVPDEIEDYARHPRMMNMYYYIDDSFNLIKYRLYDFEADCINFHKLLDKELKLLTADTLEHYSKIQDKRTNDYDNIPS